LFDELANLSQNLGEVVDQLVCEYDANWKIYVENTLDEYHAKFLHKTTFGPLLSNALDYSYFGRHSKVDIAAEDDYLQRWMRSERLVAGREIKTETYFHYVVFPMLTVASTFGVSFSLQTFKPMGPEKT
jgi:choline monooxygenase